MVAGGHSLLPMMKLRIANPEYLVDINDLAPELGYVVVGGINNPNLVRLGAMTRHREILDSDALAAVCPIFRDAERVIADPVVRNRGTLGGSLCQADPAEDLSTVCTVLDAVCLAKGPSGEREIAIDDFLVGPYETALAHNEVLIEVRIPLRHNTSSAYAKVERRVGDWAITAAGAAVTLDGQTILAARVGLTAVNPDPVALAELSAGLVGQPATEEVASWGRVDLGAAIDTQGRNTAVRSDLASAFGDWESIREQVHELAVRAPERIDTDVLAALRSAERAPAGCTDGEYLALATADGPALEAVAALADSLRRDVVGDEVTFVVNRNINFTNICYTGCRFCAFAQRKGDADAYSLSVGEVADRAWEAHVAGATEVCMQGGIDPELPVTGYADLVRAVKARVPSMHVHAFSPMEIANGVTKSGLSIREWLIGLREAGLDTIPGTAAEILDDEVRWVLTKGKLPTSLWIEIVTTAHEVGLRSSSTMMYGHVDSPRHWVAHLNVLRDIQDRTGGFTEFVPLPFVHQNSPLYLAGAARPGPSHRDNRAVHALARIMLHGRISHIQTSWVKLGVRRTQVMLEGGANDLGGTLMEETISRMAGSEHGSAKTVAELVAIAEGIGRPARQRTTTYALLAA